MDLSIITVTWNSKQCIKEQITSVIRACREISCEHIIVDNDSPDGTHAYIKEHFPHVKLLPNHQNLGFSAANNRALRLAHGDYYLFLNPDMRLEKDSLDRLLWWMKEHPDVGIAAPLLLNEQGNINTEATPRRFPRLIDHMCLLLKIHHVFPQVMNHYLMKDTDFSKEQDVDSVRGSCMLMRKDIVQTLGFAFDPRYFIWYEDVDICHEAKRLGYRVVHTPVITATDYIGQSFKQRTSMWKQVNFTKSMLTYVKKWEPWYAIVIVSLLRPISIAIVKIAHIRKTR